VAGGPDAGLSAERGLVGPLGIEGSAHVTPWPHRRLDWTAGATLTLGHLGVRGGFRYTWLSDAGLLDGVEHEDTFAGPYLGVALAF